LLLAYSFPLIEINMSLGIFEKTETLTPFSGVASTTLDVDHYIVTQLYIKSENVNTTFSVTLTNNKGIDIFTVDCNTNILNETMKIPLKILQTYLLLTAAGYVALLSTLMVLVVVNL